MNKQQQDQHTDFEMRANTAEVGIIQEPPDNSYRKRKEKAALKGINLNRKTQLRKRAKLKEKKAEAKAAKAAVPEGNVMLVMSEWHADVDFDFLKDLELIDQWNKLAGSSSFRELIDSFG